jgi:hypothetical protein
MQNCAALSWSARKSCRAEIEPLEKKKKKDKFLFSSGSPRGRSAWALGKKGNQRGSEVRLDCPRISGLVLFPPPIFINPEKDKS